MSTLIKVVIPIVVVALIAVGLALLALRRTRSHRLREEFGPEYDRAVERYGGRAKAERELVGRKQRHERLDIRPLDPGARERYRQEWTHIQEQFVDNPEVAVEHADRLVTTVMAERGYPTKDFEDRISTLSVDHARTLDHYRRGHEISARASHKEASTEDLRQATMHYRALFEELLRPPGEQQQSRPQSGPTGKE